MRLKTPKINIALAVLFILQTIVPSTTNAGEIIGRLKRLFTEAEYKGTEPAMGQDCAMECLAQNIDWLEHHIDTYGSVVAKQPDIWGEARLTKHRDEYERLMFRELGQFNNTINASIRQRDGAFLSQAFALSAAATGTGAAPAIPEKPPASVQVGNVVATLPGSTEAAVTDWKRFGFATSGEGDTNDLRIKLDPVTHLDQKSRYLKHLHELRRINEGDDTSDSPGYSLNLVRIPVSILPGKLTRQGFGAEITVTAEPVISDDLMPTTFRNLVVNDLVHLLGLPLVRVTENVQNELQMEKQKNAMEMLLAEAEKEYESAFAEYKEAEKQEKASSIAAKAKLDAADEKANRADQQTQAFQLQIANIRPTEDDIVSEIRSLENGLKSFSEVAPSLQRSGIERSEIDSLRDLSEAVKKAKKEAGIAKDTAKNANLTWQSDQKELNDSEDDRDKLEQQLAAVALQWQKAQQEFKYATTALQSFRSAAAGSSPAGRSRQARNPLNPSSMDDVIGKDNIKVVAKIFESTYYGRYIRWSGGNESQECTEQRVNLLDARKFLDAEIQAAYEMLSQKDHLCLFAELAEPGSGLAAEIRNAHFSTNSGGNECAVQMYRRYFFSMLHASHGRSHISSSEGSLPTLVSLSNPTLDVPNNGATEACENSLCKALESYRPCVPERKPNGVCPEAETPVEALAWAIVVESALLNERLNRDVRKLAKAKDAFSLNTTDDHWFFLPDTVTAKEYLVAVSPNGGDATAEHLRKSRLWQNAQFQFQSANEVFKEYVRVRWPIHVFAVDPVSQDQNVADSSARKRELQFALALGFTSGQIGANSLTQFSRDLATEVETISLNRTIVGFGHGADTFGWRFYPRVQGLNAPGTLGAIRETIMGTSRDYDLKRRQIEPGQRECVAVVLMPSFVPYADFDIRTDWFKLTNPKNTALTMKDSLKLSRAVTAMRNSRATCAECQHLYREGELRRLFKRVDQLDRELPLQTQRSMVPYENTLGGFEMFNTGVTDLSPELIGWYGAPGVNTVETNCGCYQGCSKVTAGCTTTQECKDLTVALKGLRDAVAESPLPACQGPGTTLFLVGDNFSVHDTRVIAGGVCIPQVRLISRELMQVTIPHCINTVELCENGKTNKYVAIYIATPYGVTNHLHVPVIQQEGCGGDCSSSVVNQNTVRASGSTASVRLRDENEGGVQQSAFIPELHFVSSSGLDTPERFAALIESNAAAEAEALASGILTLSKQLESLEADVRALTASNNQSLVDVRVSYPDSAASTADHKWCDSKDFPLLHRFKVKAGEQWRNCRDNLPGN